MGYRIDYQPVAKKRIDNPEHGRISALTGFFLLLFVIMTHFFWPEGKLVLQRILIPGDPAVTVPAMDTLLCALSQGENTKAALEVFCLRIMEGAGFAVY